MWQFCLISNMVTEQAKSNVCFFSQPLADESLFSCLTNGTLAALKKIRRKICFRKGEKIFNAGEIPRRVYILSHGRIRLYSNVGETRRQIRLINEREIIGLNELLGNFEYETTAEALTDCECDFIPRDELLELLRSDPQVCFRLLDLLGKDLQKDYHFFQKLIG